jgi:diadenosine tetraphosphate (Ap4A) HIT family hydrolase
MSDFELDTRLANDSLPVTDLELCSVRLMNDSRFPWLLLVPRCLDCVEILDLNEADQDLLWAEIRRVAAAMQAIVRPDKLNIAALGNVVAQLHVHLIARFGDDAAWPAPVWGVGKAEPWTDGGKELILALRQALGE